MKLVIISLVGILLVSGCHNTVPESGPAKFSPGIAKAIHEFQTKSRAEDNYAVPRKLLPLLKLGLSKDEVKEILGEPRKITTGEQGGSYWSYGLFYSMFIDVEFNREGKLVEVQSPLLSKL